ncbi:hypothetical protein EDC04DRAFT_2603373 [Pisolithus marmoratus]|nr:hypothetical protein EDC04DRAFT_2603373 [Pisolithus marmoratus]
MDPSVIFYHSHFLGFLKSDSMDIHFLWYLMKMKTMILLSQAGLPSYTEFGQTQVRWNVVQIPMTQGMTHPPSATSQLLGGVNPPIPPVGPAIQGAKLWQIQFYKPVVQDVLKCTKQLSYCNMASINSFPLCAHFSKKAIEYVEEAISERQSKGLPITDGWWPHYVNDICKLLWESLGNWHLALRKKAHTYVTQCYKTFLETSGAFLRDGIDENTDCQGYTNNLTHPALAGLIVDFFYTSSSLSLGKLFPEVFSAEVPRVAVAIAATVVTFPQIPTSTTTCLLFSKLKVILNKMVSLQIEVNFRKCDTSVIHAEKMKSLQIHWASLGSCAVEHKAVMMATTSFDIDLN